MGWLSGAGKLEFSVPGPGMVTALDWGSATDIGLVRQLNEDAVVAEPPLFAVADGMGGHAAGEVASGLALAAMRHLATVAVVGSKEVLEAIADANRQIVERASGDSQGMGTTLSGLCLGMVGGSPHWIVFNVGDSRVYRFSDGVLEQLTTDHSEVQELVSIGHISAAEARVHPNRNVITRSLGTQPAPTPDLWVIPARQAEAYLVCSDGLTGEINDEQIRSVLAHGAGAQLSANELCDLALSAGGHDNISVVIVRGRGEPASQLDDATAPRLHITEAPA